MMQELDGFGAYVDECDAEEDEPALFNLPDGERLIYQVGNLTIPHWLMEGIANQHVVFRNGYCDVLVKGRYLRAPAGFYVIRSGTYYTLESPRQNQ